MTHDIKLWLATPHNSSLLPPVINKDTANEAVAHAYRGYLLQRPRERWVKKQLFLCDALSGILMLYCSAVAETDKPSSSGTATSSIAPIQSNRQPSKAVVEECEEEWRANQEAMMKHDKDEDSYVAQCRVKDDVPALPSMPKTSSPPSPAPK